VGRVEHKFPVITIGPLDFNLVAMMTTVIAGAIVFLIGRLAVRNLDVRQPRGWQNLLEWLIEFVRGLARTSMTGEGGRAVRNVGLDPVHVHLCFQPAWPALQRADDLYNGRAVPRHQGR
jgi:F0F1-type ATP synthase, subunit a